MNETTTYSFSCRERGVDQICCSGNPRIFYALLQIDQWHMRECCFNDQAVLVGEQTRLEKTMLGGLGCDVSTEATGRFELP